MAKWGKARARAASGRTRRASARWPLAVFALGAHGRADEIARQRVELDYVGTADCMDARRFVERVRERGVHLEPIGDRENSARMRIELVAREAGTEARLTLSTPSGERTERVVEARDCREAVDAIALVAALALSPAAHDRAADGSPQSERANEARPSPPPEPDRASTPEPPNDEAGEESTRRAWFFEARALGVGLDGAAPSLLGGGHGAIGLGLARSSLWSPAIRIGVIASGTRSFPSTDGVAHFSLTAGSIELCPLRVAWAADRAAFRLCSASELGVLLASGTDTEEPESLTVRHGATGVLLSLETHLTSDLALTAVGAALFPVFHDRFLLGERVVFETPLVAARFGVGLSWTFARL